MRAIQNIPDSCTNKTNEIILCNYPHIDSKDENRIPLISIIIPLFNEENTIKDVIDRIPNHQKYEIIIVDDGSTDNSIKKVNEINDKEIKLVKHQNNLGYGEAVLTGLKYATGDIIVTLDSDGQHNPEELSNLIKPINNNKADIVIGSRYLGKCNYKLPLYVQVGAYFVQICLRLLYFQKIRDNQCGFRAFKSNICNIFRNMYFTDMGFSTELLFKAAYYNYKIIEVPISINPRKFGTSYVNLFRITKSIILCIIFYIFRKFNVHVNYRFLNNLLKILLTKK